MQRGVIKNWPRLSHYMTPLQWLRETSKDVPALFCELMALAGRVLPRPIGAVDRLDEQIARGRREAFGRRLWLLSWHRDPDGHWQARLSGPDLERTIERRALSRSWAIRRSERAMTRILAIRSRIGLGAGSDPGFPAGKGAASENSLRPVGDRPPRTSKPVGSPPSQLYSNRILMALHPLREALGQAGLRAYRNESSFKPEADAALARFQSLRDDLERQVRRGDLTVKAAREKTQAAAAQVKSSLGKQVEHFGAAPRVFLDRLIECSNARKRSREHMSVEGLHRETNRLLRQSLVEQQLMNRAGEFEGKTFVRSFTGSQPAPTLNTLLAFHDTSRNAGDEAAQEWARRQLEGMRARVTDPADQRRIDLACDRPDAVNPRLVAAYLEAVQAGDSDEIEPFVQNALESRDANACVAAFLLARDHPRGTAARWVREVLSRVGEFPDAALETLRADEAEARGNDIEAARAHADYAIALAEAQVSFSGVVPPTREEMERQDRLESKPVARLGQPIGLALDRRGYDPQSIDQQVALDLDAEGRDAE